VGKDGLSVTDTDHLAAILASPEDDFPRLAYSDWLDEQGESDRAEFIRVQCALESMYPTGAIQTEEEYDKWMLLRNREKVLLNANFGKWADDLPESLVTKECPHCIDAIPDWETNAIECRQCEGEGLVSDEDKVEFRRGFIATVSCTAADWLEHGPEIVSRYPVEEVRLSNLDDLTPQLMACWTVFSNFSGHHIGPLTDCEKCNAGALRWARHEAVQRGLVPEGVARAWGVEVKGD